MIDEQICNCDIESPLYNDLGTVKCQYCGKVVDKERADDWVKYNIPKEPT